MKHAKSPLVFTSRPYPITNPNIASQLRIAFAIPEFQQRLADRQLMGGVFLTKREMINYFTQGPAPRFIQRGSRCAGFAIASCQIDEQDRLITQYLLEGPRQRQMRLAIAAHLHLGGVPINIVTSNMTPRDANLVDMSVIAVSGFYYAHKDDTWD